MQTALRESNLVLIDNENKELLKKAEECLIEGGWASSAEMVCQYAS